MIAKTKPRLVILSGSGISAESGLKTFRDSDGLWENHRVEDVATPQAWFANPEGVLRFYNERRNRVRAAKPNAAHCAIAMLETRYAVTIITQNIDDLHERGGSTHVLHLHGEILKARSSIDESLIYEIKDAIQLGDTCAKGSQIRPHIVWFGEGVPLYGKAQQITRQADVLVVVGTSLMVYPAAHLVEEVPLGIPKYIVDPKFNATLPGFVTISKNASVGIPELVQKLMKA